MDNCQKTMKICNGLFAIGAISVLAGVAMSQISPESILKHVFLWPGVVLAAGGFVLSRKLIRCPHCGKYPGGDRVLLREMPDRCENCGKEL